MNNRDKLRQLLDDYDMTQAKAAELIAVATKRPCSSRAVRSWLNNPDSPNSRPCPDYALDALHAALDAMRRLLELRRVQQTQETSV